MISSHQKAVFAILRSMTSGLTSNWSRHPLFSHSFSRKDYLRTVITGGAFAVYTALRKSVATPALKSATMDSQVSDNAPDSNVETQKLPALASDGVSQQIHGEESSLEENLVGVLPKIQPVDIGFQQRQREFMKRKQKKVAMLLGYCGQGYNGMQWNPDVETIESELFKAMAKLGMISADWQGDLQQLNFQRCARTDKGVSAAGQVISIPLADHGPDVIEKVNAILPPAIRLFGVRRTTRGFNSKTWCSSRTYLYMLPTFAFAPLEDVITYDYRINPEKISKVNELLQKYVGSNNFHNFTVGIKAWQDAAKRYMKEIICGPPFVRDGVEWCVISVKGQSFMMHQIRKMVGFVICIMRGHLDEKLFETIYTPQRCDIPKAPGLGLMLQAVHFDMYNQKFGRDGVHETLEWPECVDAVEKFKEEHVFPVVIRGEKEGRSMLEWLAELPNHIYGVRDQESTGSHGPLGRAWYTVEKTKERSAAESEGISSTEDQQTLKRLKVENGSVNSVLE